MLLAPLPDLPSTTPISTQLYHTFLTLIQYLIQGSLRGTTKFISRFHELLRHTSSEYVQGWIHVELIHGMIALFRGIKKRYR